MPSTYSPNLRIELIANGEQSGTWGTTTNTNLGTLIEDAIAGYVSVSITSADQALTANNGAADQSRNMVLNLTTTTTAPFNVYIPPAEKFYVVRNASAYNATIYCSTVLGNTTAAGLGVTVLANSTTIIFSDGTNVRVAIDSFSASSLVATSLTVNGNTTLGDASTDAVTVNGYMGVGGAGSASAKIVLAATQTTTGSVQYGINGAPVFGSDATSVGAVYSAQPRTSAASYTINQAIGYRAIDVVQGAGSTITSQYGVYIEDQTKGTNNFGITSQVSSGSNKWNIYASGTAANYFAGNVGISGVASLYPLEVAGTNANTLVLRNTTEAVATDVLGLRFATGTSGSALSSDNALAGIEVDITQATPSALQSALTFSTNAGDSFTERMRITSAGNVGIGTTAPLATTDVAPALSAGNIVDALFVHQLSGVSPTVGQGVRITLSANTNLTRAATITAAHESGTNAHYLAFGTSANGAAPAERMRIDSAGNVGIGTSSPGFNLDVTGAASTSATVRVTGGSGANTNAVLDLTGRGSGNQFNNTEIRSIGAAANGGTLTFHTDDTSAVLQERMRIDSSGNVGIGTSSPEFKLTAFGALSSFNARSLIFKNTYAGPYSAGFFANLGATTARPGFECRGGFAGEYNGAGWEINEGNILIFYSGTSSERMRLDASGRLLVGTTSGFVSTITAATTDGSAPTNTSGNNALRLRSTATAAVGAGPSILFEGQTGNTTAQFGFAAIQGFKDSAGVNDYSGAMAFYTQNSGGSTALTERMRIDSAGNLGLGVTPSAWSGVSSIAVLQTGTAAISSTPGGGTNTTSYSTNAFYNGTNWIYRNTASASRYDQFGDNHRWFTAPSGTAGNAITFTQAMTLDASGRLLVGLTSTNTAFGGKLQVEGTSDAFASLVRYSSSAASNPAFYFGRSKSATLGTNTIVASGDALGAIVFSGANGTGYSDAASIQGLVDGTPGASADMPGRLVFSTSADGSATPTERMRIDSSGNINIATAGARITGDFSNATVANRVMFQTSSAGSNSVISAIPNGAATQASFVAAGNSTPTNASYIQMLANGTTDTRLISSFFGTGTFLPMTFYTGGGERMRIDTAGNLGLGVTPSAWGSTWRALEGSFGQSWFYSNTNTITGLVSNAHNNGTNWIYKTNNAAARYQLGANTGDHQWLVAGVGTAGNAITFTQAMTLASNGFLGLSQTNPTQNVHVGGPTPTVLAADTSVGSTGNIFMRHVYGSSGYMGMTSGTGDYGLFFSFAGTALGVGTYNSVPLLFGTANTERARITSGGDLLVGKTAANVGVDGCEVGTNYLAVSRPAAPPLIVNRNTDDGTLVSFRQATVEEGTISVSGTTVSYNGGHLARWSQLLSGQRDESIVKGTVLSNLDEMCEWLDAEGNPLPNEQLNRTKVSDVEGDTNVAGVFVNWDNDDQDNHYDMNIAMTGDMIIRIAQGVTVQKGDLLMSAGDGTAKPQGDDIVRSKTVAKVTSNHVTCTYDDGSYCVPCVLMAC